MFQRTASFTVPARTRRGRSADSRYPALREAARNSSPGTYFASTGKRAAEFTPEEREASAGMGVWRLDFRDGHRHDPGPRRQRGCGGFRAAQDPAGDPWPDPRPARSLTPTGFRSGPSGSRSTPIITRPSTDRT
ncbi:hypothetical protein AB5I41_08505 [Sphingomonas sp. MMS24-JH45]